jgi:hypothetical protein
MHTSLDGQKAAFGLRVLFSLHAGLHLERNGSADSQGYAGSHYRRGRSVDGGQRRTGAAHQLDKVDDKVDVLVKALAGQVKPVAVVGVEGQVIAHGVSFVSPQLPGFKKTVEGAEVVEAGMVAPGCVVLSGLKLSLWASREPEVEGVETFNVTQSRMPALSLAHPADTVISAVRLALLAYAALALACFFMSRG